jgi:hypothetical protein
LLAFILLEHLGDLVDKVLYLLAGLTAASPLIQLTEDVNGSLKGLGRIRRDLQGGILLLDPRSDLTGELVETILFGLLHHDVVGCTGEVLLDDVELTKNEVDLAKLPLGLVVSRALVVLATEQGPVSDIASASLVAAKVVRDDLT